MGRRKTDPELNALRGNPGKRVTPVLSESELPADPVGLGEPPEWLGSIARKKWREMAISLAGFARTIDRDAIEDYCRLYEKWREAEALVQKHGAFVRIRTTKGDWIHKRSAPAIEAVNLSAQLRRAAAELGLALKDRAQLKKDMPAEQDALTEFIKAEPPRMLHKYLKIDHSKTHNPLHEENP